MKVLLLTQAFPPHPEVGAIRSSNVVQAFVEAGHSVTVVTQAVPGGGAAASAGSAVRVIPVEAGASHASRVSRFLRKVRGLPERRAEARDGTARPRETSSAAEPERPAGLRRLALAALSIPDADNHLIKPFERAAAAVLQEGADLLYSSAPPFSLHLCAERLQRRFRIPWVAEFRDPWQHPWSDRAADLHPLTRGIGARLERRVLAAADLVVMATEAAREFTARKLPPSFRNRFLVARNGVPDWSESAAGPPTDGPFRLVHAGSFYMGRNPAGFFEGLARFVERKQLRPVDLQVDMIGKSLSYQGNSTAGLIERLGLAPFVRLEGWLPHAESRQRLLSADALLLFAQGQPLQVPNKLYEYLATGRPILAFVDRDGESAALLRDLSVSHLFYEPDAEAIAATLARLFAHAGSVRAEQRRPVIPDELTSRAQMRALVAEVGRRFGR